MSKLINELLILVALCVTLYIAIACLIISSLQGQVKKHCTNEAKGKVVQLYYTSINYRGARDSDKLSVTLLCEGPDNY